MKNKEKIEIITYLYFAIDHTEISLKAPDLFESDDIELKFIYTKHFGLESKSLLRIVTETISDHQEIKSIHFKKNKKATN